MVAWPATLPQSPLLNGYQETEADTSVRTQMDAGPAKVRQRFQAGVKTIVWPTLLTTTQKDTLNTFYRTTLQGGSQPFTHTLPDQSVTDTLRFTSVPQYNPITGSLWSTTLQWEVLPK